MRSFRLAAAVLYVIAGAFALWGGFGYPQSAGGPHIPADLHAAPRLILIAFGFYCLGSACAAVAAAFAADSAIRREDHRL